MDEIEHGTVELTTGEIRTFLIADVRGYTRFTVEQGDAAAARLASRFAELAEEVVVAHEGEVIELRGDEALAVFLSARNALRASMALQARLRKAVEEDASLPLNVGIGLDVGEAIPVRGGYRGGALNLAARLCALAAPGEILASDGVVHLARKMDGVGYVERGALLIKGFADPIRAIEIRQESASVTRDHSDGSTTASVGERETVTPQRTLPVGGFLGALPSSALVGRTNELHTIDAALQTVSGGSGRLVLLAGEPGVGKTRLAQEVTVHLRNMQFLVAAGRCYEPRASTPLYPFVEALEALYSATSAHIRAEIPRLWPHVGRLLPNENIVPPAPSSMGQADHDRLLWATTGLLQAVAAETPVALLLDDLHWADASSLEMLQHLARHTRGDRVFLLGTYRDVEVGRTHPLERALRDLHREGLVDRMAIRRLGLEETTVLLATAFDQSTISQEFAALVHQHTDGNPFFVHEVLQALIERGDIYRDGQRWERREVERIEIPESIRSAIGERLSRLDEAHQEVLYEASVLGQTFRFEDLQALAGREEALIEGALDAAIAAGLVIEVGRDTHAFNHALTQQALYGELSARRRRRLHRAAGEALERPSGGSSRGTAAELAWHFLEGDDSERALRYAIEAGDEAGTVFAHVEAERQYLTALELMRDLRENSRETELLQKLGTILRRSARYEDALQYLQQALEIFRATGDFEGEAHASASIGLVDFANGNSEEGARRLGAVIAAIEDQVTPRALADMYASHAYLLFGSGHYLEHLSVAKRLLKLAQGLEDDKILATAQARYAAATIIIHGHGEAERKNVADAVRAAERINDPDSLAVALVMAGEAEQYGGSIHKALQYRERQLTVAQQVSDPGSISFALCNLAETLMFLDDWEGARIHLEQAMELTRGLSSWFSSYPPLLLGQLLLRQGDWITGVQYLDTSLSLSERGHDVQTIRGVGYFLTELDLWQGNSDRAMERLRPVLQSADNEDVMLTRLLPLLAEAQIQSGVPDEALKTSARALDLADHRHDNVLAIHALCVRGMALAAMGDYGESKDAFQETLNRAQGRRYAYGEARALFESGLMLKKCGEIHEAREQLQDASVIYGRLGAKKAIERTEDVLTALQVEHGTDLNDRFLTSPPHVADKQ